MTHDERRRLADLNDEAAQLLNEVSENWILFTHFHEGKQASDLRDRINSCLAERKALKEKQLEAWKKEKESGVTKSCSKLTILYLDDKKE